MRRTLSVPAALAALVLLAGCSADGGDQAAVDPAPTEPSSAVPPPPADPGTDGGSGPAAGQPPVDDEAVPPRTGSVSFSGSAHCVEEYSPDAVADRAFSFAGTVTMMGESVTDRHDAGDLGYAGVTFRVEEWFGAGDGPETFTVDMGAPTKSRMSESAPSYGVGSRLLVSGEDRWGEGGLEAPIAWGCGFTRYFDEETAASWRS